MCRIISDAKYCSSILTQRRVLILPRTLSPWLKIVTGYVILHISINDVEQVLKSRAIVFRFLAWASCYRRRINASDVRQNAAHIAVITMSYSHISPHISPHFNLYCDRASGFSFSDVSSRYSCSRGLHRCILRYSWLSKTTGSLVPSWSTSASFNRKSTWYSKGILLGRIYSALQETRYYLSFSFENFWWKRCQAMYYLSMSLVKSLSC